MTSARNPRARSNGNKPVRNPDQKATLKNGSALARGQRAYHYVHTGRDGKRAPKEKNNRRSAVGHFLGHVEEQLAIPFIQLAQQAAKPVEKAGVFPRAAPGDIVRRLPLGEVGELRRFFTVVEELIERHLESAGQLLERFNGWGSGGIFNAGDVATKEGGPLLDVTLGEVLVLPPSAEAVTYNHGGTIPCW